MGYLIIFLAGIVFGSLAENLNARSRSNLKLKSADLYQQEVKDALNKAENQLYDDLAKAREEFAKMQLTKLLYDILKDILKDKQ